MAFLAGSLGFERFQVNGDQPAEFTQEHLDILEGLTSGKFEATSEETTQIGFLGGFQAGKVTKLFKGDPTVIADAVADLGRPEEIGKAFSGFQKYLYQAQA